MRAFRLLANTRSMVRGRRTSEQLTRILQTKSTRWNSRQFTRALAVNPQILSLSTLESQLATCTFQFDEEDDEFVGNAWNAGWLRHYCAGGPTPGKMAEWFRYCKMAAGAR